jgi:hypothetical protein
VFQVFDSVKNSIDLIGQNLMFVFSWLENTNVKHKTRNIILCSLFKNENKKMDDTFWVGVVCSRRRPPPICQPPTCIYKS